MRPATRHLPAAVLLLLGALPSVASAATPGLVVAVDTSRSLRPAELRRATALAAGALAELPGETPTAVVGFDDEPHWLLSATSPQEAAAALGSLVPAGDYTLLHDALFTAMRSLDSGGTVLLLSDGRDENSATTLEDVARLSADRGVSVLTVGLGQRVEERVLRRLAMLTGGRYLGRVEALDAARLAEATGNALGAAAERRPRAQPAAASRGAEREAASAGGTASNRASGDGATPATAAAGTAVAAPPPAPARRRWWLLGVPLAVVALGAPVVVWARRRRAQAPTTWCRRCGSEHAEGEECPTCLEAALQQRLRGRDTTRMEDTAELRLDEAMAAINAPAEPGAIEKTRVLIDQSVLLVREPGETPRSYLLGVDGAFAIGRDPRANTLPLRDPALSAHHLKVVPEEGAFYIVDLDSTNGTFLNQRRVRAARLSSGDVVRAGQVEVEFRTYLGKVA